MNIGVGDKQESEMEMSVVNRRGGASRALARFFANRAELESFRGEKPIMTQLAGRCVGLTAMAGYSGLGNGFNLLETSFAPVRQRDGGLQGLSVRLYRELADMIQALRAETGLKAHRLRLRDRIFRYVRYAGDHDLQRLPERPFKGLEDYFRWMCGGRTISRFLPRSDEADYKSLSGIEPLGVPSLARTLSRCDAVALVSTGTPTGSSN